MKVAGYPIDRVGMASTGPAAVAAMPHMPTDNTCPSYMFDCLGQLWDWFDPQAEQSQYEMENNKVTPATQQPHPQHHHMAHHVHPAEQIYNHQPPQVTTLLTTPQPGQVPPNGVLHQLLQSQYKSNMDARSPLLENRHELYGTGQNTGYASSRQYGVNDNYNSYPQSPPTQYTELQPDHNVNHELVSAVPPGYNAEVYQDYLKRNPPKDSNQIYQNHQSSYNRPNTSAAVNNGTANYVPYPNRPAASQSNKEILKRQYNELQQMKMQQQMHYQSQAQMYQQQKFAERQILLQQLHGVQPPPNLQNSIYSEGSYRDMDRYGSRNDFKEYNPADIHKEIDKYVKNNEYKEIDKQNQYPQEPKWQTNHQIDYREVDRYRKPPESVKVNSPPSNLDFVSPEPKNNAVSSPMKSSESSSPSVRSPSSESRKSSGGGGGSGGLAIRSPVAQRSPSAPVTMSGVLYKQGSDGLKVWRKRWFVLAEYCLFYYKSREEEKVLGSVLLPSYSVRAADERVQRRHAFTLEHANMRTYVLAAPDAAARARWLHALSLAAAMRAPDELTNERPAAAAAAAAAVKAEELEEAAGPTYANAPPKPRRSNEGYNSPSPEMYDPNYDLLKKPASHYSPGTSHMHQPEQTYQPHPSAIYTRSPQPPPPHPAHPPSHPLTLPLTNINHTQPLYKSNAHTYYDNRDRIQQQLQKAQEDQIYDRRLQPSYNPFVQETSIIEPDTVRQDEMTGRLDQNTHYKDTQLETSSRTIRPLPSNERGLDRRTPETYGRSTVMSSYNKGKTSDYEDVYGYTTEIDYNKGYNANGNNQIVNNSMASAHALQEKTFAGPSVLRKKKMQLSGIQPPVPRPHSADFLEYESKHELLNKTTPFKDAYDIPRQPQRPKSSLDINSYYDPSSDRYYSEESYAAKMRQSAQYLQAGMGSNNIQIPLAKYASGLAEKQLHSPFTPSDNNNYEMEFATGKTRDNIESSKYNDDNAMQSNWTLKEKEDRRDFLNRQHAAEDNAVQYAKGTDHDHSNDGFTRSASARLPSASGEKEGEMKVQQREESMKRLLEWKQRMLQSPLTRKSTPATISLARSLNQARHSLRSDQYKPKNYGNTTFNTYSSDDEALLTKSGAHTMNSNSNYSSNPQTLTKKPYLGSNTSIGRNNRESSIPVRAVSPRVRWVEEKQSGDIYGSQMQMSISQQNLYGMDNEDAWADPRSPSRASQQPIRAVSPRVRRSSEHEDIPRDLRGAGKADSILIPTAGELLGRTHEELVLLLIQLRRRHAATHRAIEQCCAHISSIEENLGSLKSMEREESLQRLDNLKMQLMDLEHQYEKSKPLVQLVDNMVKLGSLYNRPASTIERLERNQRLREKVLAEHAMEQQRWVSAAAAGRALQTAAARARAAELWALERELADEAALLRGLRDQRGDVDALLTGVRTKFDSMHLSEGNTTGDNLEAELARVHAMLALNSKKLEQTVADNARLERELAQLRRALQAAAGRAQGGGQGGVPAAPPTAVLEDEVTRVQQLVSALQRQRQDLSRAVRHLTQQSEVLQTTHNSLPGKNRRPQSAWQETNLDVGLAKELGTYDYPPANPGYYNKTVDTPLYVDTRQPQDVMSPGNSDEMQHSVYNNLSNVEKPEIKTVRIVKRESERRQRDRDRSFQPMTDWPTNNLDHYMDDQLPPPQTYQRPASVARTDFTHFDDYYSKDNTYSKSKELSPRYPSSPSLSTYDYSRDISSLNSSYNKNYDRYDRTISASTQYLNSPTDSARTLTNDPVSKASSIGSLTRSQMELSPIFKSEAAKQIITEMSSDVPKNGSIHRRQVPKEKRRHYTAPHHLSAKTLNELPKDVFNDNHTLARSVDDADMERALRASNAGAVTITGCAPDVVRSSQPPPPRLAAAAIDQLLAAPQKILIPERYIPEKPPELSPEEQLKRQEKVESIKKMLSSSSADPNKSPDTEEKKQRDHLLQMNQILAKQVTEMSKIIAVKALEELPYQAQELEYEEQSPETELPIFQQRDNYFT